MSVVIPVGDGKFLEPCLRSITEQTFSDFELVLAANGVCEGTADVLWDWARRDARIRLHQRPERAGMVGSANDAVAHARGALVARMDADDVAHRDRLRQQLDVFRRHSDAVLVGTLADGIDAAGRTVRPRDRARLRRRDLFVPFPHGSAMFRRDVFEAVGGYRSSMSGQEDLDLFVRLAARGRVFVIPHVLYHYRYHAGSSTAEQVADGREAGYLIWAGERPPPVVVSRREAGGGGRSLVYGTWGRASPASLRAVMGSCVRLRDRLASRHVGEGPVEWHFESPS